MLKNYLLDLFKVALKMLLCSILHQMFVWNTIWKIFYCTETRIWIIHHFLP